VLNILTRSSAARLWHVCDNRDDDLPRKCSAATQISSPVRISRMTGHETEATNRSRAALKLYCDNRMTALEADLTARLGEPLTTYAVWQEAL